MYLSIHFIVAEGPLGFVNFPISLQDAAAAAASFKSINYLKGDFLSGI